MTELICFVCGFVVCAVCVMLMQLRTNDRNPYPTEEKAEETAGEEEADLRGYLRQYENFLNYSGSERGQMSIENQN